MRINLISFLLLASSVFISINGFGQRTCGSHDYMLQQMKNNPRFAEKVQQIELYTKKAISSPSFKASGIISIPVHVIVVYSNSTQNISDAQIQSQISVLNKDYRKSNTDWPLTPAEFLSKVSDVQVEFTLQGIERHSNSKASWGLNDEVKIAYPPYSPTTHLNFWVATITGGYLGYAQFPGGDPSTDGVVISPQYFGSSDFSDGSFYLAAPYDKGRTATHEVGHWLNLRHIWGDASCGNDYVDDTPTASTANYGCPSHPHFTCNSNDMFMNYMDYTDDACMYMFTTGQTARVRAVFDIGGPRESFVNGGIIPCSATACNNTLKLTLKLDNYPSETSWILKSENGSILDQGTGYTTAGQTITKTWTLSAGKYTFVINDSYGDGICCSSGSGSYTLTDGCNTVLKTGGDYGLSELATICISGSGTNVPPVAEANGPYSGVTNTAITFNSAGSSDSDGTISSYLWNFGDGTTSALQNPTHVYTTAGTFNITLTVTDNSGATASDVSTATVTTGGTAPVVLSSSTFESGWGIWTDGGGDCSRYTSTTYAYAGVAAIDIQDNSAAASSFYMTTGVDVLTPGYSLITVDFYFYAVSMETGEDFWVQYYNGSTWSTVASYIRGTNFNNTTFYHATVTIPKASYTYSTNMKIRFMCDASDNNDDVYIDNITLTASSGTAKIGNLSTIEAVGSLPSEARMEEVTDNLKIYPNPAGNEITIDVSVEDNSKASIYNLSGTLLYSTKLVSDVSTVDISKLEPGFYIIKVESGNEIMTKRIIKK